MVHVIDFIRLIDKPVGISSFDVIRHLREKEGIKKAGHAGTLDPSASGLLIVGVGREGTKKLTDYIKLDKVYDVTIELGLKTDTGDMEGEVLEDVEITNPPDRGRIEKVLSSIEGVLRLPVPKYSAVKVGGEPLYKKARRGESFIPPKRDMRIYKADLVGLEDTGRHFLIKVVMEVASGVYIRSVSEEVGNRLHTPAVTASLRRTRVGQFSVDEAEQL